VALDAEAVGRGVNDIRSVLCSDDSCNVRQAASLAADTAVGLLTRTWLWTDSMLSEQTFSNTQQYQSQSSHFTPACATVKIWTHRSLFSTLQLVCHCSHPHWLIDWLSMALRLRQHNIGYAHIPQYTIQTLTRAMLISTQMLTFTKVCNNTATQYNCLQEPVIWPY